MTTVKSLAIVALLLGGTSLALAQTPPTAGPKPSAGVTTGPTGAPAYKPSAGHATTHHKKMHMSARSPRHQKMYMSAKGTHHHKGSKLNPSSNATPQTKQ